MGRVQDHVFLKISERIEDVPKIYNTEIFDNLFCSKIQRIIDTTKKKKSEIQKKIQNINEHQITLKKVNCGLVVALFP